jgi:hypothetical protein
MPSFHKKANMTTETIDHATLARLVDSGVVQTAHVVSQSGGWAVRVRWESVEKQLAAQRSRQVRLFRRLETLVSYLKGLGLQSFEVNVEKFDPRASKTHSRPDRSAALKHAHQAASYDQWFRSQVQASIDDSRQSIADEEARRLFAARKAGLRSRSPSQL